ncbi:MAG TPA: aspartate aminotransferase family protein [Firmicutes bacterium]|nr:aspartate aminotransferase family protein [Bacillota bacterium]
MAVNPSERPQGTRAYLGPEKLLEKKKEYLIPCVYHFYEHPPQIVRGAGKHLYDSEGREYLDFFAGVSVVNCGHCHPEIIEALVEQARTLQHTTTIYLTQPMLDLAERLARLTPGDLKRSFFCSSGTEANETAVLLAKLATGKTEVLSLRNGLHGRTQLAMSLTGMAFWRTDPAPVGGITFAPSAYCYRCALGRTYPSCDVACAREVENVVRTSTSGRVAALIAEPIQGNGGIITPPPEYFPRVREILDRLGMLLIIDEVQTGFGRTGKWFAIEHWGVTPDIMTMAKALANGQPVGAVIVTDRVAQAYTRPGSSTLGGNPVTATTALATLDVLEKYDLPGNAARLGPYLREGLERVAARHRLVGDVRGIGLMQGMELVKDKGDPAKEPAPEATDAVLERMKDRGFLIGKNGFSRNVLAFQPPLIIDRDDVDRMVAALDEVLSEVEAE